MIYIKVIFDMHQMQVPSSEAATRAVVCKKVFLEILQKLIGKHLCQFLFFNKVTSLRPATLLKKRSWHRCFPMSFCEISKNTFFTEHLWTSASNPSVVDAQSHVWSLRINEKLIICERKNKRNFYQFE